MTEPANILGFRHALEARLRLDAERASRDLGWIRRRYVFQRAIHRIAANTTGVWVLKGGVAVELRRPGLARATRDIDLALRSVATARGDGHQAGDALQLALRDDPDGDRFIFVVGPPHNLAEDAYGRPAWRFHVSAELAGKSFVEFRIDVIERPDELVGLTDIDLPAAHMVAGPIRAVSATDLRQQFAEKLHALTRSYASGASTRVKDLVDLVLLIEDEVPCDARLAAIVRRVFAVRGSEEPPHQLGPPPVGWVAPFSTWAAELDLKYRTTQSASDAVNDVWRAAQRAAEREDP